MSFVFAPAATRSVSLSRKNYNNIKNHLTILRLIVLRSNFKNSNLIKFANLASNFIHRNPHLENANLTNKISF
nr:hypothetical protein [uncultured Campylobacter sp.]